LPKELGFPVRLERPRNNSAPATLTGPPVVITPIGRAQVDIFVRGPFGRTYENQFAEFTLVPGGWINLGGSATTSPDAVATADGNVHGVTTDGVGVSADTFHPADPTSSGWQSLH
jgi:hypothetical protein